MWGTTPGSSAELAGGLLTAFVLFAQAPPAIEVASVRVHSAGAAGAGVPQIAGNRLTLGGNVNQLVMYAYDLKAWQVGGGPAWVTHSSTESDYYDISVLADGSETLTQPRARQLLQALLAERFRLRLHREKKEMPVYALVQERSAPKIRESVSDAPCKMAASVTVATVSSTFTHCSMDALMRVLAGAADRPVLDETRLSGLYDFSVSFARNPATVSPDSDAPSLYTAVQEQLGLRLDPRKGPVEILLIDGVERPSGN